MAIFKRSNETTLASDPNSIGSDGPSIEQLRRRARRRLLGAVVLVVLGVLVFPLIFDTQSRPVSSHLTIDIPAQSKISPQTPPKPSDSSAAPNTTTLSSPPISEAADPAPPQPQPQPQPQPIPHNLPVPPAPSATPSATRPLAAPSATRPLAAPIEATQARPILAASIASSTPPSTGTGPTASASSSTEAVKPDAPAPDRYMVQAGAFLEIAKAKEARTILEKAGLKTFTHEIPTPEGKLTRVRIGPFNSRAEAEAVAERAKALQVPAKVLKY